MFLWIKQSHEIHENIELLNTSMVCNKFLQFKSVIIIANKSIG